MRSFLLTVLLALPLIAGAEEPMGRLFLTPGERASLDYLRQTSKPPEKLISGDEEEAFLDGESATPAAPPAPVAVQGYVKRSDGKGTVWVNNQPLQERSAKGEVEVGKLSGKSNRVTVKLPGTGQTVELKAGQIYDPVSGKIVDHARDIPVPEVPVPPAPPASADKP